MEKGSHATRQGTLVHLRLSSLGHGGPTLDLKEQDWRARAELYLKRFFSKEKEKEKKATTKKQANQSSNIPPQSSQAGEMPSPGLAGSE